jgi:hypothetical protein
MAIHISTIGQKSNKHDKYLYQAKKTRIKRVGGGCNDSTNRVLEIQAMIIVHEKPRAAIPVAEADRLRGYNDCADGTQALPFVAGLLPYLKTFVDDRIEEDSTLEQILKWAVKGEQSRGGLKGHHSINAVQVEDQEQTRDRAWAAEMTDMETRYNKN